MKRWIFVCIGIMFLVTACPNQKKWEESLKQWEQAVNERDAIIQQQEHTINDREATITDLQAQLTICQQKLAALPDAAQPTGDILGLVAYYPFNGNANDESGNQNHGLVYGATLISDRHGNAQSAYEFNGEDQYIKISSTDPISALNGELSIVAWIKITEGTDYDVYDYRQILSKGAVFGELWADYALGLSNPKGALFWEYAGQDNGRAGVTADTPIPQGTWTHVGVTFGKQRATLYVNGEEQKTYDAPYATTRASSQPLYIGCRYHQPFVGGFRGGLDDVRIYNRSLTKADMQKLYHLKS